MGVDDNKNSKFTELMQVAIARVQMLPEVDQDYIAWMILQEIESEEKWEGLFRDNPEKIEKLVELVQEDIRAGRFTEQGWDEILDEM